MTFRKFYSLGRFYSPGMMILLCAYEWHFHHPKRMTCAKVCRKYCYKPEILGRFECNFMLCLKHGAIDLHTFVVSLFA